MTTQIQWGDAEVLEPFRFELSAKPGGQGRKETFELPNLASSTLPWELIPFAQLALKEGPDGAKTGDALAIIINYLNAEKPRVAAAIRRTGDHATDVLMHVITKWVEHAGIDPKA